jgi:hypothetical protein
MIRRAVMILTALGLTGCAAQRQAAPPPAPLPGSGIVIPAPPPRGEPAGFANLPAAQLRSAFGAPAFVRRDGATEMWRYDGATCRAFFFLYGTPPQLAVRHVETLPRGAQSAADPACLNVLRASKPS